ncbi:hypothetical protein F4859DRAFT_518504 [Xylaria cf. heliscus]|nr:hypothetical protein F4859DRAFT_518504 [Xylaria cf. heliscus]
MLREALLKTPKSRGKLSLSELLNALYGVPLHQGRVLFMATNHIEPLDGALIQAGHADKKLELAFADENMATQLFKMVFKPLETDTTEGGKANNDKSMEQFPSEFASKLRQQEVSPAEIQCFLLKYGSSPCKAVENIDARVAETRDEKAKRVDRATAKVLDALASSATSLLRAPTLCEHAVEGGPVQDWQTAKSTETVPVPAPSTSSVSVPSHCSSNETRQHRPNEAIPPRADSLITDQSCEKTPPLRVPFARN